MSCRFHPVLFSLPMNEPILAQFLSKFPSKGHFQFCPSLQWPCSYFILFLKFSVPSLIQIFHLLLSPLSRFLTYFLKALNNFKTELAVLARCSNRTQILPPLQWLHCGIKLFSFLHCKLLGWECFGHF